MFGHLALENWSGILVDIETYGHLDLKAFTLSRMAFHTGQKYQMCISSNAH